MTVEHSIPNTFDWVSARAGCNVKDLFQRLRDVVEADVQIANEHNPRVKFDPVSERKFRVIEPDPYAPKSRAVGVVFSLNRSEIRVAKVETDELLFSGRAYLLDGADGTTCTLNVNDKPLKMWQVSRLALEDLIFA